MEELLTIGAFARLTHLTIKALRLYDARGLLRPAIVDFTTGYRYYHAEQAAVAERIRRLRSLEMPLTEIRAVLSALDPDVAAGHLTNHQRWLEQRVAGYQRALLSLKAADELQENPIMDTMAEGRSTPYACSFCGKPNGEVERMIAGPKGVFICDVCVERCNEIITEERAKPLRR